MSNGTINKVILIGFVGQSPTVKKTDKTTIANLSLATTEKVSGDKVTEWHRIVFFGKLAEIVDSFVQKGNRIFVEGRQQTRKWKDKSGNEKYTTEVIAHEMQILSSKDKPDEVVETSNTFTDDDIPF